MYKSPCVSYIHPGDDVCTRTVTGASCTTRVIGTCRGTFRRERGSRFDGYGFKSKWEKNWRLLDNCRELAAAFSCMCFACIHYVLCTHFKDLLIKRDKEKGKYKSLIHKFTSQMATQPGLGWAKARILELSVQVPRGWQGLKSLGCHPLPPQAHQCGAGSEASTLRRDAVSQVVAQRTEPQHPSA